MASAAAQHTGLPAQVEPWLPGGQVMKAARAIIAPSGMPDARPLASSTTSGATPKCSAANMAPVRPMPDCTSSNTSRIPCASQMRRSPGRKSGGGSRYPPSPSTGSTTMAATSSGATRWWKRSRSTLSRLPHSPWYTPGRKGPKCFRYLALLAVSDSAP